MMPNEDAWDRIVRSVRAEDQREAAAAARSIRIGCGAMTCRFFFETRDNGIPHETCQPWPHIPIRNEPAPAIRQRCAQCWTVLHPSGYCAPGDTPGCVYASKPGGDRHAGKCATRTGFRPSR